MFLIHLINLLQIFIRSSPFGAEINSVGGHGANNIYRGKSKWVSYYYTDDATY